MKFVSKDLAIKLKEKGFDKPCFGWYDIENNDDKLILNVHEGTLSYKNLLEYTNDIKTIADAPTIEQVLEWLREKDIIVYCKPYHAMATKNHIMYEYNVGMFNVDTEKIKDNNEIVYLTCIDNDYGYVRYSSFDCFANYDDAILACIKFIVEHLI